MLNEPADVIREKLGAAIAARGAGRAQEKVAAGEVVLVEAPKSKVTTTLWATTFGAVEEIPDSIPPRNSEGVDAFRTSFVLVTFAAFIVCMSLGYVQFASGGSVLLTVFLLAGALSLEEAYSSIGEQSGTANPGRGGGGMYVSQGSFSAVSKAFFVSKFIICLVEH